MLKTAVSPTRNGVFFKALLCAICSGMMHCSCECMTGIDAAGARLHAAMMVMMQGDSFRVFWRVAPFREGRPMLVMMQLN